MRLPVQRRKYWTMIDCKSTLENRRKIKTELKDGSSRAQFLHSFLFTKLDRKQCNTSLACTHLICKLIRAVFEPVVHLPICVLSVCVRMLANANSIAEKELDGVRVCFIPSWCFQFRLSVEHNFITNFARAISWRIPFRSKRL